MIAESSNWHTSKALLFNELQKQYLKLRHLHKFKTFKRVKIYWVSNIKAYLESLVLTWQSTNNGWPNVIESNKENIFLSSLKFKLQLKFVFQQRLQLQSNRSSVRTAACCLKADKNDGLFLTVQRELKNHFQKMRGNWANRALWWWSFRVLMPWRFIFEFLLLC